MTTTYTFEQLKEDVRKEAEALRVHATKEERERLDVETFEPRYYDGCIYGQCTGDCNSDRAIALIQLSTPRYFKEKVFDSIEDDGIEAIIRNVNGATVKNLRAERKESYLKVTHYSAIEAYILLPEAKNANLIAFLKGETDNLEL